MTLYVRFGPEWDRQQGVTYGPFASLTLRRGFLRTADGVRVAVLKEAGGAWIAPDGSAHTGFNVMAHPRDRVDVRFRRDARSSSELVSVAKFRVSDGALYLDDTEPVALRAPGQPYWAIEASARRFEFIDVRPVGRRTGRTAA